MVEPANPNGTAVNLGKTGQKMVWTRVGNIGSEKVEFSPEDQKTEWIVGTAKGDKNPDKDLGKESKCSSEAAIVKKIDLQNPNISRFFIQLVD